MTNWPLTISAHETKAPVAYKRSRSETLFFDRVSDKAETSDQFKTSFAGKY